MAIPRVQSSAQRADRTGGNVPSRPALLGLAAVTLTLCVTPMTSACTEQGKFVTLDATVRHNGGTSANGPACAEGDADEANRTGPCCYAQVQGAGSDPDLRMSQLRITKPTTFASALVDNLLDNVVITEGVSNIILNIAVQDTLSTLTIGNGSTTGNGSYLFDDRGGEFPVRTVEGTFSDEVFRSGQRFNLTVPVVQPLRDGGGINFSLPLKQLRVVELLFSEERSCVGTYRGPLEGYSSDSCTISAFFTIDETDSNTIQLTETTRTTLCSVAAGLFGAGILKCDGISRTEWENLPDSVCDDEDGCTVGACDPLVTCNAWEMAGNCAGHGIRIQ